MFDKNSTFNIKAGDGGQGGNGGPNGNGGRGGDGGDVLIGNNFIEIGNSIIDAVNANQNLPEEKKKTIADTIMNGIRKTTDCASFAMLLVKAFIGG